VLEAGALAPCAMPPASDSLSALLLGAAGEQAAEAPLLSLEKMISVLSRSFFFSARPRCGRPGRQGGDHGRIGAPLLIFDRFVTVEYSLGAW